ncbi:hypothetical protein INR49_010095 [Caranx melampygus]|nr:hypothetical protein INR49_010095 [Caranx melampygus]
MFDGDMFELLQEALHRWGAPFSRVVLQEEDVLLAPDVTGNLGASSPAAHRGRWRPRGDTVRRADTLTGGRLLRAGETEPTLTLSPPPSEAARLHREDPAGEPRTLRTLLQGGGGGGGGGGWRPPLEMDISRRGGGGGRAGVDGLRKEQRAGMMMMMMMMVVVVVGWRDAWSWESLWDQDLATAPESLSSRRVAPPARCERQ